MQRGRVGGASTRHPPLPATQPTQPLPTLTHVAIHRGDAAAVAHCVVGKLGALLKLVVQAAATIAGIVASTVSGWAGMVAVGCVQPWGLS